MTSTPSHRANRLANETSPYLLQHAHNPVDWYPWGEEAIERARAEDKPIFLSIGYSACHWCHVMERESFEDEQVAALLNRHFVCIKVDREERPDLDEIYMKAVQAMTGSGGWPMSVFMTPALEPFWGGTYFPPRTLYGRPGFTQILNGIAEAWRGNREKLAEHGAKMAERIASEGSASLFAEVDPGVLDASLAALGRNFDATWGGFGDAPKFPHATDLRILLRHHSRTGEERALHMAVFTLDRMAAGGIHDQLAGGFHRYSTDEKWLIPHFEKMLYDNALLVPAYVEAWLVTREPRHERVVRDCLEWMLREMRTPEGGFASTQDADSEGEEGKYFVWTPAELEEVLGKALGARAAAWWGVTDSGNFEHGASALWHGEPTEQVAASLHVPLAELEEQMEDARARLLAARSERVAPGTDDKVLASWNGLAISALCQAWQVFGEERWLDAARAAARFVLTGMRQEDGRLFATSRHGRSHLNAYLDDYAFMTAGLIDLFESDFDGTWLTEALALTDILAERFEDPVNGGFFTTGDDHEKLIARLKNPHDGALPSGNGVHALNLLRLAEFTGRVELARSAETTIRSVGVLLNRYPTAFSQMLQAVDFVAVGPREIVVTGDGDEARAMLRAVRERYLPQRVVVHAHPNLDAKLVPLVEGKPRPAQGAQAFVCRNWTCDRPVDDVGALVALLE